MAKLITKVWRKGMVYIPSSAELLAKNFSEAQIVQRAKADPDAQPLTPDILVRFKRVNPVGRGLKSK